MAESVISKLMQADAVLPADVVPDPARAASPAGVLVTGATGFLGKYVVRELWRGATGPIHVLVRGDCSAAARQRVARELESVGVDLRADPTRLRVVVGCLENPRLGLAQPDYEDLARRVGTVYHCAAAVNWALGYRRLRASNVVGTLEIIRFACVHAPKQVFFCSTIAVCFASPGPENVDESTDMLPYVEGMPLGYAQSKCVAESLLREAARRGVPVSIVRPALISGDTLTGDANHNDLICALIQGCVRAGVATDSDWQLDSVPVDYVARVLFGLRRDQKPGFEILNLINPRGRHWRELVLWMNLYGYQVRLVPHAQWLARAFERADGSSRLFNYRRFFSSASHSLPPYETYLGEAQRRLQCVYTRNTLRSLNITIPPLSVDLIERYFEHYVSAGLLPDRYPHRPRTPGAEWGCSTIGQMLTTRERRVIGTRERPFSSDHGIFNEISSVRVGGAIGMRRYEVRVTGADSAGEETLDVLLKTKPSDKVMEDLLVAVAALCDPGLGILFDDFRKDLGLRGCHERELAIYERATPAVRSLMPRLIGTCREPVSGMWSIAMEYLPEAEDVAIAPGAWTERHTTAVLRSIGACHGAWYKNGARVTRWLSSLPHTKRMKEMRPLWMALAGFSDRYFKDYAGRSILSRQHRLIETLGHWWPALQTLPRTMIHNDFNPRNLVLQDDASRCRVRVFDWELATLDVPQRDAAELLCFVFPPDANEAMLMRLLETHREVFQRTAGIIVEQRQWLEGFVLSLHHLIINRLPLYTLMHRFRPQPFLPGVIRNWGRLERLSRELRSAAPRLTDDDEIRQTALP